MALPKASIANSASFQIAGTPFVIEATANKTIDFKYVTRAVTIQSSGSGTGNKVSFDGGTTTMTLVQNKVYRLDVRCKQMIITRATGTISVVAELTNVQAGQMVAIVQNNYQWIYGCMDSTASNYNSSANISDGSCTYATPDGLFHLNGNLNQACSSTDLSITGATDITYSTGKFSNAAVFNGSTSDFHIETDAPTATDDTNSLYWDGEFTVDLWVKFENDPMTDNTNELFWSSDVLAPNFNADVRLEIGYVGNGSGLGLSWANDGWFVITGEPSDSKFLSMSDTVTSDTWYHIALTRDSSNKLRFFRDGTLLTIDDNTTTYSDGYTFTLAINPYDQSTGNGHGYLIGSTFIYGRFEGMIDEIRIHKGDCLWTANFTPPGEGTC